MKSTFYQYVDDVIDDKIVVGKQMKKAVERFLRDVDKKDFIFDEVAGTRIVTFAEQFCHHWKGPKHGQPFVFEPHQHFYEVQKYGWKNPENGLPRFRRSLKMIARKQYKTTEIALESLFHLVKGIDRPAQVFTCATKEDDAVIVVNDAGRIAMASPKLRDRFYCQIHEPYVRRVIYGDSFMTYMTKGHDAVDISMGVGDECHDWPNASIKNRIESSMGNRIAPTFSAITTAGFNKSGYCFVTQRDTGLKILDGTMDDDEQLVLIFELDPDDDWKNPDVWEKSNPNLRFSLTHKRYLESEFKKALNEGGTTEVNFKTKNLNLWVDAPEVWIQTEVFMKNMHGTGDLAGRTCYGALQLISGRDLNAFCLFFPEANGQIHAVRMLFFLPAETFNASEMSKWGDYIHVCPGNVIDNDFIYEKVVEEIKKYNLHSIAFPSTQENNEVVQALVRAGVVCNPITQGYKSSSEPTFAWESLLTAAQIDHFGNPVLKWCNSNTMAIRKGDDIRIERQAGKTCGIVACVNAVAQWKSVEALNKNNQLITSW